MYGVWRIFKLLYTVCIFDRRLLFRFVGIYRNAHRDDGDVYKRQSKGLLFYYFYNKKSLYLYLFDYCAKLIMNQVMGSDREADAEACEMCIRDSFYNTPVNTGDAFGGSDAHDGSGLCVSGGYGDSRCGGEQKTAGAG